MTDSTTAGVRLLAGRYRLGELLGRGGMADVHSGQDARLGRTVAIKLLKPSLANDPAFRTRFRQEAQAAARMAHPTIVRVFDAGEETVTDPAGRELQVPFIVMERVEGRLLKDLVAQGPLPVDEAVRIVDGILTALEYSHRAGVVHRDIKPGNVMVTPNGQVKVMDFGIARAISDSSATIAQTSAILGTAQYFSPEQARGEAVDARTDLYSTGVVLYELLTGRPPFQGETAVATAYQHVSETPPSPDSLNPSIPKALNAVVLRALAKDRFERYQTAADFRQDLESALEGKVGALVPIADDFNQTLFGVNPNSLAMSEATLRRLADDDDDRAPRTQSRPPVAWIWGGIAMLIVIVVAAGFWIFSLQAPPIENGASVEVPDLVGEQVDEATAHLEELGLVANVSYQAAEDFDEFPEGTVMSVNPEPGTRVSREFEIDVIVSSGAPLVNLPSLVYSKEADAIAAIESNDLVYGQTRVTYSANIAAGVVMGIQVAGEEEIISGATQLRRGTTIDLLVSNGLVNVPDVKGEPVTEARARLQGANLQLTVRIEADGSCAGQAVTGQSLIGEVPQKSTITLRYCAG